MPNNTINDDDINPARLIVETKIFLHFRCSQNGDISYEVLYTIDDQSLPSPFTHNSRCPPESITCTEHYVLTIKGDKMMPRVEDNQRVALTIRSKTEVRTVIVCRARVCPCVFVWARARACVYVYACYCIFA